MAGGLVRRIFLFLLCALYAVSAAAAEGEMMRDCSEWELRTFVTLSRFSQLADDDAQPNLEKGPAGTVALLVEDPENNLIIAFRGAIVAQGEEKKSVSKLWRRSLRKEYKGWAEENIQQAAGFMPKQYGEAAALVRSKVLDWPREKYIFLTGHSKGGGAAEYAAMAVHADPSIETALKDRLFCTTFNPVIVRSVNWEELFKKFPATDYPALRSALAQPGKLIAITLAEDPASHIPADDRAFFGRHIVIEPDTSMDGMEQHKIAVVIDELIRYLYLQRGVKR